MSKGYLTETEINLRRLSGHDADFSQAVIGQLAVSQESAETLLQTPFRGPQQILATHDRPNKQRLPSGASHPPKIPGSA